MSRSTSYTYNVTTGEWESSVSNTPDTNTSSTKDTSSKSSDNLTSTNTDSNSATGEAEKKANEIEYETLSGTLNYIATADTIQLCAGDTVTLKGLGKYLSGDYYVQDVTRSVSSKGYSHSATLIRTDLGDKLTVEGAVEETKEVKKEPENVRTHTVSKGDTLWGIAKKYYGNGSQYTKIYDENTSQIANPNLIYIGQVLTIP